MVTSTFTTLLGPDDPAPVEVLNSTSESHLLFLCDHASAAIPSRLDRLGLDEPALSRHIAWDIGASALTRVLADRFEATAILSGYSRLVIDCNRDPLDPTSIPVLSDDVIIPGNKDIGVKEADDRAQACFWPYHRTIEKRISDTLAEGHVPVLFFLHSFTPVYRRRPRPWHVGVLWRADPRIPTPLLAALRAEPGLVIGDNEPYSARSGHDYSVEVHGARRGLPHVAIEVRQDLIDTKHDLDRCAEILERALRSVLSASGPFTVTHY